MAKLLLKNTSNIHPDPEKNQTDMYKHLDLVYVLEDWQFFGTEEVGPKFMIKQVPGSKEDYMKYLVEQEEQPREVVSMFLFNFPQLMGRVLDQKQEFRKRLRVRRYAYDPIAEKFIDKETFNDL